MITLCFETANFVRLLRSRKNFPEGSGQAGLGDKCELKSSKKCKLLNFYLGMQFVQCDSLFISVKFSSRIWLNISDALLR